MTRAVAVSEIPARGAAGGRGASARNRQARSPRAKRHKDDQRGDGDGAVPGGDQHAGDCAEEDREKGAGFDEGIAEQQLVEGEEIREDRVFQRTKESRLYPHREEQRQEHGRAAGEHAAGGGQHHRDLDKLDQTDQPRLVHRVGELAGRRRAQEERQYEEPGGERDQDLR